MAGFAVDEFMITVARTYRMLGSSALWATAQRTHEVLDEAGIPHAILGGVAVGLHGYRRNTIDVDFLVRREDADAIREGLTGAGFSWNPAQKEFVSTSGIPVQFLTAGDRAGPGSQVRLPDPSETGVVTTAEGLPVLTLARLIESKIACGEGSLRRTHKDFADVVELIAARKLNRSFARHLHRSIRSTFRELVLRARGAD